MQLVDILEVYVDTVGGATASRTVAVVASTCRAGYTTALNVIAERTATGATPATMPRSIEEAVLGVTRAFVFGPPDGGRLAAAAAFVRPWQRHMRLPECIFGETEASAGRFRPSNRKPTAGQLAALTDVFRPVAQPRPLKIEDSRWDKHATKFAQSADEYFRDLCTPLPWAAKSDHFDVDVATATAAELRAVLGPKSWEVARTVRYEKRRLAAERRLGPQGHRAILKHLRDAYRFVNEGCVLYATSGGELVYGFQTYSPWLPAEPGESVAYDDHALSRVFKQLGNAEAWRRFLARAGNVRFEVHARHQLDYRPVVGKQHLRDRMWLAFVRTS